ncbi:unnamed protein product [Urochloa humidicola]
MADGGRRPKVGGGFGTSNDVTDRMLEDSHRVVLVARTIEKRFRRAGKVATMEVGRRSNTAPHRRPWAPPPRPPPPPAQAAPPVAPPVVPAPGRDAAHTTAASLESTGSSKSPPRSSSPNSRREDALLYGEVNVLWLNIYV